MVEEVCDGEVVAGEEVKLLSQVVGTVNVLGVIPAWWMGGGMEWKNG